MGIADNAGINTEKRVEQNLVPELEAAGKRLIDYAIQRITELFQKLSKGFNES